MSLPALCFLSAQNAAGATITIAQPHRRSTTLSAGPCSLSETGFQVDLVATLRVCCISDVPQIPFQTIQRAFLFAEHPQAFSAFTLPTSATVLAIIVCGADITFNVVIARQPTSAKLNALSRCPSLQVWSNWRLQREFP